MNHAEHIENVRHASREIVRELGLLADETDAKLPLSFRHVLIEADLAGSLNQIDLANKLRLDKSTVSRMVHKLGKMKLVTITQESSDKRFKVVKLAPRGRLIVQSIHHSAIEQVGSALLELTSQERKCVVEGLSLYQNALKSARAKKELGAEGVRIESYRDAYKRQITELISGIQRHEFNINISLADQPDLNNIKNVYQVDAGNFWVAVVDGSVVGSVGLIAIGNAQVALRKMFVAKEWRGKDKGVATKLLETVIHWSKEHEINEIFLGTVDVLAAAQRFYEKNGFRQIGKAELPANFPLMSIDSKFYTLKIQREK